MTNIDQKTLDAFRAGDEDAASRLVDVYHLRLYHYARARSVSQEMAEDAVQDAFVEAFRQRDRLPSADKLSAWLFTLTRRRLAREFERGPTKREFGYGDDQPDSPQPETQRAGVQEAQNRNLIYQALGGLEELDRDAVTMKYFGGMKIREIAEALSMPQGSVGTRLTRGLRTIKAWFQERGLKLEDVIND